MAGDFEKRMLAVMESMNRNVQSADPGRLDNLTEGQALVAALLSLCYWNMIGVRLLLSEGYAEPAQIVCRTLMVDAIRIAHLHNNSDRLETLRIAFDLNSLREERNLVKERAQHSGELEETKTRLAEIDDREAELRREADALGTDDHDLEKDIRIFRSTEELHKVSPQPEIYYNFRLSSQNVHTSRIAIDMHQSEDKDGVIRFRSTDAQPSALQVGLQAAGAFLIAYRGATEVLAWRDLDAIRSFFDHANEQLRLLTEEANVGNVLFENLRGESKD